MQAPNDTSAVRRSYDVLRKAASDRPYPDADTRDDQLRRLAEMIKKYDDEMVKACSDDFGFRVAMESRTADVLISLDAARGARTHLREWMMRRTVPTHPMSIPSHVYIEPMPLGVVAIISPWNYPFLLALSPLAGALAAGNRVLIKPSELSPRSSALLAKMIAEYFKPDEVAVVQGGADVAREVTSLPVDHIVFTGSTQVGRLVAKAAADNLVPTTLELGGKSPALVHPSASLDRAAERIALGKTFNGGQTCIAPDYALVPRASSAQFVEKVKARLMAQHPNGEGYTSMISDKALKRIDALIADAKSKGAKVVETFKAKDGTRALAPVILLDVKDDMQVMQEEIFGPILPIETYDTLDEAIARINARPHPLAFYYFDDDQDRIDDVLKRVPAGGVSINDTLIHIGQESLPFGGVGPSGMGAYHGVHGFEAMSHMRGVINSSRLALAYNFLKPPFAPIAARTVNLLIRGLQGLAKKLE